MSRYISFVFHQKSAKQEVKAIKNVEEEEEDPEYKDDDDPADSDYSE